MASTDTTLVIKNPSRSNTHFSVTFRLDGTIAELQQLLHEKYDGQPAPADQTLIYGGKVLKDTTARLRDIVSKHDAPEGPHSIHLVIRQKPSTLSASPARSVDSSAAAAPASASRPAPTFTQTPAATRPIPPPTRTVPAGASAAGAEPSGSQSEPAPERPATDPSTGGAAAADNPYGDGLGAAPASFWNTAAFWGGYPQGGSYVMAPGGGVAYGMRPPQPPTEATPGTAASAGDPAAAGTTGTPAAAAQTTAAFPMPYTCFNPVVGCAYQAAYSAALAALSVASQPQAQVQHPQQQPAAQAEQEKVSATGTTQIPSGGEPSSSQVAAGDAATPSQAAAAAAGVADAPAGGPGGGAVAEGGAGAAAAMVGAQQYVYVPMFVPAYGQPAYPFAYPGQYPFHPPGPATPAGTGRRQGNATLPPWLQHPLGLYAWDALGVPPPFPVGGAGAGEEDEIDITALFDALDGAIDEAEAAVSAARRTGGRGQAAAGGQGQGGTGAGAAGAREGQHAGLRQRRGRYMVGRPVAMALGGENNDPAAARNRIAQALAGAGAGAAGAVRRPRVFTIRISTRMLLQVLVFAVVLYQHFTWRRFLALLIGGAVLLITSTWAPFRRLMRGVHALPHQQRAAGAAGGGQQEVQRRGILHEILVFIVGFITSLLPAWNFNPEDAAAFAAAQEIVAAADRAAQQPPEAAAGAADAAGGDADAGQAAAAAEARPDAGARGADEVQAAAAGL